MHKEIMDIKNEIIASINKPGSNNIYVQVNGFNNYINVFIEIYFVYLILLFEFL